jgi:hypothetical protein
MRLRMLGSASLALTLALGCGGRSSIWDDDDCDSMDTNDEGPPPPADGPEIPETCETLELAVTSECFVGDTITSTEHANGLCEAELGAGWSWLEFHATWGWSVTAQINPDAWSTASRAWVWIDDQDAECFSSPTREVTAGEPERFGMTWQPVDANDECRAATCNDPQGLDEPGLDPIDTNPEALQCNAYDGDTPCSRCRPLLCVRTL